MQWRVVGQMESWRGLGRRVSREALGWLAAARKSGTSLSGVAAGGNGPAQGNGVGGARISPADGGRGAGMSDARAGPGGAPGTAACGPEPRGAAPLRPGFAPGSP